MHVGMGSPDSGTLPATAFPASGSTGPGFMAMMEEVEDGSKASGWQRQYEERTRPGKKAKIDAQKAAIRQEDMAKGIYTHVADLPRQEPKRAAMQVRPTL